MADEPNRIEAGLLAQDSNTRRFHVGKHPQAGIPPDLTEEEQLSLDAHRQAIHAPEPRPASRTVDADGNPVPVADVGLVITDPATGATAPIETDEEGKAEPPTDEEREAAAEASREASEREQRQATVGVSPTQSAAGSPPPAPAPTGQPPAAPPPPTQPRPTPERK